MTNLDEARRLADGILHDDLLGWEVEAALRELARSHKELDAECERQRIFIEKAFMVHSNLDLDIESVNLPNQETQLRAPLASEVEELIERLDQVGKHYGGDMDILCSDCVAVLRQLARAKEPRCFPG